MKTRLLLALAGLAIGLILPTFPQQEEPRQSTDDKTAVLVAQAYVLSRPRFFSKNQLIQLLAENKAYFRQGGKAISCMEKLGPALIQAGMS